MWTEEVKIWVENAREGGRGRRDDGRSPSEKWRSHFFENRPGPFHVLFNTRSAILKRGRVQPKEKEAHFSFRLMIEIGRYFYGNFSISPSFSDMLQNQQLRSFDLSKKYSFSSSLSLPPMVNRFPRLPRHHKNGRKKLLTFVAGDLNEVTYLDRKRKKNRAKSQGNRWPGHFRSIYSLEGREGRLRSTEKLNLTRGPIDLKADLEQIIWGHYNMTKPSLFDQSSFLWNMTTFVNLNIQLLTLDSSLLFLAIM